jgi:hypothetical protein
MVHRDLTFSTLTTAKHALLVYRSRSDQTLYVSTPFLPGAKNPSFMQALLGQIISAYCEALERNKLKKMTQNKNKKGDVGQDGQNDNDVGHHGGNGRSGGSHGRDDRGNGNRGGDRSKSRRKYSGGGRGNGGRKCGDTPEGDHADHADSCGHYEEGLYNVTPSTIPESNEKAHRIIALDEIPVATRSSNEQLALSKVCHFLMVHDHNLSTNAVNNSRRGIYVYP